MYELCLPHSDYCVRVKTGAACVALRACALNAFP
jgi:hypothetical protein